MSSPPTPTTTASTTRTTNTPEPCDEALKGQLCRSSLVNFHYGDGILNDLAPTCGRR